jgi:hypothetical protein
MWPKVYSGFGYWDVYVWLIFFGISSVLVLWLRSLGRADYKEGTEQDEIFYGSNEVPKTAVIWVFRRRLPTGAL